MRAGIADRPEHYRWNSIGHHVRIWNGEGFLSPDFGQAEFGVAAAECLRRYRRFLCETGAICKGKGVRIDSEVLKKEREKDFNMTRTARFAYRTRHFSESGIIGTKEFVSKTCQTFKHIFNRKMRKHP